MLIYSSRLKKSLINTSYQLRLIHNSLLNQINPAPPDKILGLTDFYNNDPNPLKVNLTVGIYKDNNGHVSTFPSVLKAQSLVNYNYNQKNHNLAYLPINGNQFYSQNVLNFIWNDSVNGLGQDYLTHDKINFIQTLSGTGAIAITAKFLSKFLSNSIWVPNYSWPNHLNIFKQNGFDDNNIFKYDYYNHEMGEISIENWLNQLKANVPKSKTPQCILLHACCHNPTGVDPTKEQWKTIIDTIYDLKMIPIIDMAYQGLESGNLIDDAYLLRICLSKGDWSNGLYLCQSFAKNMGLYGERVGSLSILTPLKSHSNLKQNIDSQLKPIIRSVYSSPPGYGSHVANQVLSNDDLKMEWFNDVQNMVNRLHSIRVKLYNNLKWDDLINFKQQHGMFYFTRFNQDQVNLLKEKYSIYLTDDGRLSLSGINDSNIDYISQALYDVSKLYSLK
ncbi:aspartate aminotransferase, mitochondrial [Monosporozyma unispora]|nr:aspartate transaminase aat1 [Kazachstania unispora]